MQEEVKMKIGVMNNPHLDYCEWIEWIGKKKFDFIDFTIGPTRAMPKDIDIHKARKLMKRYGLGIVGHMEDWTLPKDSHYPSIRETSYGEMIQAMRILTRLGAKKITLHALEDPGREFDVTYKRQVTMLRGLLAEAKRLKIKLMIENGYNTTEDVKLMESLLKRFPALGLHIDVGHANLGVKRNMLYHYMRKYHRRVQHLHFSDNHGRKDNHLYLGGGNIAWTKIVRFLKKYKYDSTITLETFFPGRKGMLESRRKLLRWWEMH
jgi:sugar phosphate isomerase/epimerase